MEMSVSLTLRPTLIFSNSSMAARRTHRGYPLMDNLFKFQSLYFSVFLKNIFSPLQLSFLRLLVTRQNLDLFALLSFLLCLIRFSASLPSHSWDLRRFYRHMPEAGRWAQGLGMLLVTSAPLFIGGFRHAVRWSWLDMLHGTLVGALVTLYWVAQLHG